MGGLCCIFVLLLTEAELCSPVKLFLKKNFIGNFFFFNSLIHSPV
jgi:hypothetical protein